VRDPVKRQITMTLAIPSTAELIPNACNAIEPATTPLKTPTAPSIVIHTRLTHDRSRARRAFRCQSALPNPTTGSRAARQCSRTLLDRKGL
jgi:hypothetical protein